MFNFEDIFDFFSTHEAGEEQTPEPWGTPTPTTEQMFETWGMDPIHPTEAAYKRMAARLTEEMDSTAVVFSRNPQAQPQKADSSSNSSRQNREGWTSSPATIANRKGRWAANNYGHSARGRGRGGGGRGEHAFRPRGRGFYGGRRGQWRPY